jgi:hypothetical protein
MRPSMKSQQGARAHLRDRGTLEPPMANGTLTSIDVGAEGEVVAVWMPPENPSPPAGPSSDGDGRPAPIDVVVAAYRTNEPHLVVPVRGLRLRPSSAQVIPDGILLVGSRCRFHNGAPELNAEVRDLTGQLLRQGCVGDGVEFVRATPSGDFWVGYFDEGVLGNLGWGGADEPIPLGAAGVVRWSSDDFTKVWEPQPTVIDAYVGTLVGDDLWASTYTRFPMRVYSAGTERVIPTTGEPTRALITDRSTVVTFGRGKTSTFHVWDLSTDTQRGPRATGRVKLPRVPQGTWVSMMGHHDLLHVFAGQRWFTLSLDEILRSTS